MWHLSQGTTTPIFTLLRYTLVEKVHAKEKKEKEKETVAVL